MSLTVGFLGFGSMATAICKGGLTAGVLVPENTFFSQRNTQKAEATSRELGIKALSNELLIQQADIVILGVKPYQLQDLSSEFSHLKSTQTVVSLLAGTTLSALSQACPVELGIIRTMPNTPSLLQKGMTALSYNAAVSEEAKALVNSLFTRIGLILNIPESHMDIVTALSGSGPAFVYKVAADFIKEGVAQGLSEKEALLLVSQTFIGAGEMLKQLQQSPDELVASVASPGGTTEAGLKAYDSSEIAQGLTSVIRAAADRSKELSRKETT